MAKKKMTVEQAVDYIRSFGYHDALIDTCGFWFRLNDRTRDFNRHKYVSAIVWDYDEMRKNVYIETEK